MRLTIKFGKKDRRKFITAVGRARWICHLRGLPMPRVDLVKLPDGSKKATIEY